MALDTMPRCCCIKIFSSFQHLFPAKYAPYADRELDTLRSSLDKETNAILAAVAGKGEAARFLESKGFTLLADCQSAVPSLFVWKGVCE